MNREILTAQKINEAALVKMGTFQKDILNEVKTALGNHSVVVIGMKGNPFCRKIRKGLEDANVKFHYMEYGSYLTGWKKRLGIKLWSGRPTFPQVFVGGTLVGGYEETMKLLQSGKLESLVATRH